jgi:hypothetical protein
MKLTTVTGDTELYTYPFEILRVNEALIDAAADLLLNLRVFATAVRIMWI